MIPLKKNNLLFVAINLKGKFLNLNNQDRYYQL